MICGSVWYPSTNKHDWDVNFLGGGGSVSYFPGKSCICVYLWGGPEDPDPSSALTWPCTSAFFSERSQDFQAHPCCHRTSPSACMFPISLLTHGYLSSRPLFPLRTTRVKNNTQNLESKRLPQAVFCLFKIKTKQDKSALSGITGLTMNSSFPCLAESFKFPWFYRLKIFNVVVIFETGLKCSSG